nr:type I-B CRISPR-associated endonuclease Cas1b [Thermodesulfobacterium hydrogeniphilum]
MRTFYIFSSGKLERKENTLCLRTSEGKRFIPVTQVEQIYLFGETTFNTKLVNFLSQNNILLHFFNYYGFYTGSFYPRECNISGTVIVKQVEHYLNFEERLYLAKEFISSAIHNIHRMLEKKEYEKEIGALKECEKEVKKVRSITEVMLVEAKARRIYYSTFEKITNWEFKERTFRPPENPLNALISFGNSMLYTIILKEIYHTQLHPAVSFLHEPFERRFSLALDISEIFKPLIVDRLIFRLINEKQIKPSDFLKEVNFAYLSEKGRKTFIYHFDKLLESTIYHRKLKRKVKYKTLIKLELYKLIKHLLGEKRYKALKVWW